MNPNTVFNYLSGDEFQAVKDKLKQRFSLVKKTIPPGALDAFEINSPEGKINFKYYKKGKLMLQSSPSNSVYASIVNEITSSFSKVPDKKIEVIPKKEDELTSDYYIGCDEAGAGETFGSMFLGCTILPQDKLKIISNIIRGYNIRQLTSNEINNIYNKISNLFNSEIKTYSASEIDSGSKNQLLDSGYIELISKIIEGKSKLSVIIDDYGIQDEMKKYLSSLKSQEIEVIAINKADEHYTACKIASLIARKARIEEIENINKTEFLENQSSNEIILPGSGSSSNPNTARYLIEYRKKFPDLEFPSFVRKKWKNVLEIETKFPRKDGRGVQTKLEL